MSGGKKNFGRVLAKVHGQRLLSSRNSARDSRNARRNGSSRRTRAPLHGETRRLGGQLRDAYQTQLKSNDTVPVTAPPPPIKTTRARVSPRISRRRVASSEHHLSCLDTHRTRYLIPWIAIDPVHRGGDHDPVIALSNEDLRNARNVIQTFARRVELNSTFE